MLCDLTTHYSEQRPPQASVQAGGQAGGQAETVPQPLPFGALPCTGTSMTNTAAGLRMLYRLCFAWAWQQHTWSESATGSAHGCGFGRGAGHGETPITTVAKHAAAPRICIRPPPVT